MIILRSLSIVCLTIIAFMFSPLSSDAQDREFYQLKIYSFDLEDQVEATDTYLEEAYLPALKKQGITNVGVFKTRRKTDSSALRIFVLIPYSSLTQMLEVENKVMKDPVYLTAGKEYLEATYNRPPYRRIETILLQAFEDMPALKPSPLKGPRADRIYELRSYESATEAYYRNKVKMFNAGGEIKLFDRLDFNAVFYGEVISGPSMPNLMYMTTHADQNTRDQNWKAFSESPEWKELKSMPEYQNNVSHIDIFFLYPTEYSDY